MKKLAISVSGMSCEHCTQTVKNLVIDERGVKEVDVDLSSKMVTIQGDEKLNRAQIVAAINLSGIYQAK